MIEQTTDSRHDEKIDHTLAFFAKLLCSGRFVIGREADEFMARDLKTHLRPEGMPLDWDEITVEIDEQARTVTLSALGNSRTAVCNGRQGCTIIPRDGRLHFTPVPVAPNLPDAETTPWPMGDLLPRVPLPAEVNEAALRVALDLAFDDSRQPVPVETRAMAVLYQGRLIAERYAPGFGQDTRHVSWSMGKSIASALIGTLVRDGCFTVIDRAPIEAWSASDDPRREITIANLLHMSSGLGFMRAQDDDRLELGWTSLDDHMYIYYGGVDVFAHSTSRQLEHAPGTFWRYRNCDPLTLGRIVRQTVEARGEEYLSYPQRALFDRVGMRNMVLEVDPWGNFIMTGFDYGTARDWARLGLLHLRDGVWQGERILPEGWVDFVRAPAPADSERHYGGQFWLNAGGRLPNVPHDAYWPAGAWGQVVFIIPSRDIVMARLGHSTDTGDAFDAFLDTTISGILGAIS
ncbi:MAG TPA: serine hydrolase [Thermomicrobiales bacterium]|nr:serine hydrolase [Thermomicrobiales bacterium]